MDSLDEPLVVVRADGSLAFVNDAAETWLGRSRQRLTGHPLALVEPHGAALAALAGRVSQQARAGRIPLVARDRTLVVSGSPWWSGAQCLGAVLVAHAPGSFDRDEDHADVGTLSGGLAHEIRNPLAAIRGAAELLRADPAGSGEYLELILRETARVDALLARMLELAKPPVLARAPVQVAELLHDLALQAKALAATRRDPCVVIEQFDPALPPLPGDRARLFEALVNLVKNAIEAARRRVELQAGVEGDVRRRHGAGRATALLRIAIRDDGAGLPAGRDRLFTPFFTTKAQGTGLGLLLARRVIEGHAGVITLRDRAAADGAEAIVLLPIEGDP